MTSLRMRVLPVAHTWSMESPAVEQVPLDHYQVKKAVQALQAYLKSSSTQKPLLNETQQLCLLFTLWKIPKKDQTIRIFLPHALRDDSAEVCLFTRDEPNMTTDQTERFYKKLLKERGVKNMPEVIPFKVLRTEYKPFEAKRRLLGNFDIFLTDARIRHRLPSHIGKHFYERKKVPLSVDLDSKHLARDLERLVQGTTLNVRKKGSCCMLRAAHSSMSADEIVENIVTAVSTVSSKLHQKGKSIKTIHLKSHTSMALPIYTSDLSHLRVLEEELKKAKSATEKKKYRNQSNIKKKEKEQKRSVEEAEIDQEEEEQKEEEEEEEEEEIPQLVPIKSPNKKPKQEASSKMGLKKKSKLSKAKGLKIREAEKIMSKKSKKVPKKKEKKVSPA